MTAIMLTGEAGIGKAALAKDLAAAVLYGTNPKTISTKGHQPVIPMLPLSVCPADSPIFRRVHNGAHSDLLVVERLFDERKQTYSPNIKIEAIRHLNQFCRRTAGEGGGRVVLLLDADTMNIAAQNAFLKTLEEPGQDLYLVLTATQPSKLLPTVRSRLQTYRVPTPSGDQVSAAIPDDHPLKSLIISLASGSPGYARYLSEMETLPRLWQGINCIMGAIQSGNRKEFFDFAFLFNGKTAEDMFLTMAQIWPMVLMHAAKTRLQGGALKPQLLSLPDTINNAFLIHAAHLITSSCQQAKLRHLDRYTVALMLCQNLTKQFQIYHPK